MLSQSQVHGLGHAVLMSLVQIQLPGHQHVLCTAMGPYGEPAGSIECTLTLPGTLVSTYAPLRTQLCKHPHLVLVLELD